MSKIFLLFFTIVFVSKNSYSQDLISPRTDSAASKVEERDIVFTRAESMPEFAGGAPAWAEYLKTHFNSDVPASNGAPAGYYRIFARFIVGKDGSVRDIVFETITGFGIEYEVTRILKASPKWNPGRQNGRLVSCYLRQPITFVVPAK